MAYIPGLPKDFGLEVALGRVPNVVGVAVNGHAKNGIQTTLTDIWDRADSVPTQQIWLPPTAARIHSIVSTSTDDDGSPVGTGARTIKVVGLQTWSSAESFEIITLNGTTPVNTANSYVMLHLIIVVTSGSADINVGTITATAATDSTISLQMDATIGKTQLVAYGVPTGKTFHINRVVAFMNGGNANTRVDVRFKVNQNPDVQTTNYTVRRNILLTNSGMSGNTFPPITLGTITGPALIKMEATSSSADTDMAAGFDGWLVTT